MVSRMQKLPTVSVVIPTYNYGRFIAAAIDSALRQTYAPLEVIVVDDGSTDETPEALGPYCGRVSYILQKNAGPSAARNRGIRAARGEWIAFLDADDIWFEDKLRLQMKCAAENPDVCLIGALANSSRMLVDDCDPPQVTLMNTPDLLGGLPFGTSSVAARKKELMAAGLFNESRRWVEDRELWLKASLLGGVARVNVPLWIYRSHPQQANTNAGRMAENYARVLDEFFAAHPQYRSFRSFAYAYYDYDSAMSYHEAGNNLASIGHLLRSYLRFPIPLYRRHSENRFMRSSLLVRAVFGQRIFKMLRWAVRHSRIWRHAPAIPARAAGVGGYTPNCSK